jgi:hypothetical protein
MKSNTSLRALHRPSYIHLYQQMPKPSYETGPLKKHKDTPLMFNMFFDALTSILFFSLASPD